MAWVNTILAKMKITCNKKALIGCLPFGLFLMACGHSSNPFPFEKPGVDASTTDANDGDARVDGGTGHDARVLDDGSLANPPEIYSFSSRFKAGESSVNHVGQTTRQVLIIDLVSVIEEISEQTLGGTIDPTTVDEEGEVTAILNGIFRGGSTDLGARALPALSADEALPLCQKTYEDLGDANLVAKLAGEDDVTDHKDWDGDDEGSAGAAFAGVPTEGQSPLGFVDSLFSMFEEAVRACVLDIDACPTDRPLYVTADGWDLAEMTEKFLLGAINYSQASDDYLDDATEAKGLLSDNTTGEEADGAATVLEHAWDEGFGYFGAAADYGNYTDEEILGSGGRDEYASGYHDLDGDGCIDVFTERSFGTSRYAAARDAASTSGTDFTKSAFDAFVRGRWIITTANGALDEEASKQLREQRDTAVGTYEKVLAASAIHYVNEAQEDLEACGTEDYSLASQAKHWSELKGLALALQFNPQSTWSADSESFVELHQWIGAAPTTCDGDVEAASTNLSKVRDALEAAHGFSAADAENW